MLVRRVGTENQNIIPTLGITFKIVSDSKLFYGLSFKVKQMLCPSKFNYLNFLVL
jgi:hypothetical protein